MRDGDDAGDSADRDNVSLAFEERGAGGPEHYRLPAEACSRQSRPPLPRPGMLDGLDDRFTQPRGCVTFAP